MTSQRERDKYVNDDDIDCDYEKEGNVKSTEKLNETLTPIKGSER